MVDGDPQVDDGMRGRRKHAIETGCHIFTLLVGALYVLAFAVALQTGYLSWIGIAAGALLTVPGVVAPVLGLTGRRHLSAVLATAGIGLPIMIALIMEVSLLRAKSDSTGNWRPYRFDAELAAIEAERAVPDAENAAHRYESLSAVMDVNDKPEFLFLGSSLREEFGEHPWKGEDYPQASAWLDSQPGIIDELLVIGGMEKCRWPVQADVYDDYTVPYRTLRHSLLLLLAIGNRDLGEGRVANALAKYFCELRIADHLHQQPSMVDSLTGFGVERVALHMIRQILVQSDLSDEDIAQIAHHLPPAADPWLQEWERLLERDKLRYMNLLGRLYEVNEAGNVRFAARMVFSPKNEREPKEPIWVPRVYWLINMPLDPRGVRDIADRHFAPFDLHARSGPLPQEKGHEWYILASPKDIARGMCNFYRWGIEMAFFNGREYVHHRQRLAPAMADRRGTWLVLGLRRYRNVYGAWPQTLDAISQYVPPEAFLDPLAGAAFAYAFNGDGFKLYSKGPNRVDESGRHGYVRALDKLEDDLAVWPPAVDEPDTEPIDDEELKKQFAEIYGKDYAETMFREDPNGKQ